MPITFGELRLGQIVAYFDVNGNMKPALITAIRAAGVGKLRLTVFNEGATLTDVDNVLFSAQSGPSTWQPFGFSADRLG